MTGKKLANALRVQRNQTKRVDQTIYGSLGIPLGGRKLVEVPDRNSYVYVRLRDNQNEVIQAFNNKVATSYDLPVILRRESSRYIVEGVNTMRYNNNLNNFAAYLPKHGQVHSFFPGGGGDVVWTYSRQIMPLLVYPSPSNTGTNVSIYGQPLLVNNQWQYVGETGTVNLLTYTPTGAVSVMGLIYLDALTGNPGVLINSGTPMPNNTTGTGDVMPYIPVPNLSTQIPLAGVKINTGTTSIGWNNLYDLRNWVHAIPSGTSSGGGGGGGVDTIGFAGLANGVPIGTGTVLNIHGASFTRSGTVFDLNITGSGGGTVNPPVSGSFVVQNNGLTLGSALVLNFTNGVSASISGSVAQIVVTGTSTYVRTAPPISLSTVTGTYWKVQEGIFASGSLALFNQGHTLIPAIDYLEQYPSSGTFQYISTPPTGTYNLAIYGIPVAGGSNGGGGGGSPSTQMNQMYLSPSMYFASVGTWAWLTDALFYNSTHANGDYVDYYAYLNAGTYVLIWNYATNGDRAIANFLVDGVSVGTVDTNAGSNTQVRTNFSFNVATSGLKTFRVKVDGKTGSDYYLVWRELQIFQTG